MSPELAGGVFFVFCFLFLPLPPPGKPHKLTANQKNYHFEMSSSLIVHNNNEPFLNQIVTCDEKWILYNNWQ